VTNIPHAKKNREKVAKNDRTAEPGIKWAPVPSLKMFVKRTELSRTRKMADSPIVVDFYKDHFVLCKIGMQCSDLLETKFGKD